MTLAVRMASVMVVAMAIAGCMNVGPAAYRAPAYGWELCRNEMPVDLRQIDPIARSDAQLGGQWDDLQRAHLAAAVAYALALRCADGSIAAEQVQGFDSVVVLGNYEANQVFAYDQLDGRQARALYIQTPLYADFRTDAFAADLDTALLCRFAPASVDAADCLPD